MNIMVFDVPAESGGALSILNDFYNEVKSLNDKSINWYFVLSKLDFQETDNIKVLRFPWIKKSWASRIFFDGFIAPSLISKYKINKVLSLQNVSIPRVKVPQILYVHQSLPFVEYKYRFKDNKLFWTYQNIIGKKIVTSIKKVDKVIVQTEWMKNACLQKAGVDTNKIEIVPPKIHNEIKHFFQQSKDTMSTFFYPASGFSYKNHKLIIEACEELNERKVDNYKVIFTITGDESEEIKDLFNRAMEKKLPIEFIGSLEREQVYSLYSSSILIFPSFIETFGLPLLESKLHKGIIFASDCAFSREILDDYKNGYYFNPFDKDMLASLMYKAINRDFEYFPIRNSKNKYADNQLRLTDLLI